MTGHDVLRTALVATLVPLEVLNMDNANGASWMTDELRESIAEAVFVGRAALLAVPPQTISQGGDK